MRPGRSSSDRDRRTVYFYGVNRVYDSADFEACDLCYLAIGTAKLRISCAGRNPVGLMALHARYLPERAEPRIFVNDWGYVVPQAVKQLLEAAQLKRVAFRPTVLVASDASDGPYISAKGNDELWWELVSDLWMPQLAPSNDIRWIGEDRPLDETARRTRNYGRGIFVREEFYLTPELRYGRSQLSQLLPLDSWDAARTYEPFGHWPDSDRRYLVISKRFAQLCISAKLGGECVPVRITDE